MQDFQDFGDKFLGRTCDATGPNFWEKSFHQILARYILEKAIKFERNSSTV